MEQARVSELDNEVIQAVVDLGGIALDFSRVDRATYHQDGERRETDSDHTVMLGLIGCALAAKLRPDLDLGKIAQYSLIHDLVEVYAGDTVSLRLTEEGRRAKEEREAAALAQLTAEYHHILPWITDTIVEYEELASPEARFVKTLDKLMPKITHLFNAGAFLHQEGVTREEQEKDYRDQPASMSDFTFDQPELMALHRVLSQRAISAAFD